MKKVKVAADLEIKTEDEVITVKNDVDSIFINISSASAVTLPFRTYLKFKQHIKLSKNISQEINVIIAGRESFKINNGQIYYLRKWWLFKFLLKSLFK